MKAVAKLEKALIRNLPPSSWLAQTDSYRNHESHEKDERKLFLTTVVVSCSSGQLR